VPNPSRRIPKYRHHRSSGRAVVTLGGRDVYLGQYGSTESHALYARLMAEWVAAGGQRPTRAADITVIEVIAQFWGYAEQVYSKGELDNFRYALRPLKALYGTTPAKDFGPRALRAVQHEMAETGNARGHINKQIGRIKYVFKWATSRELIPASIYHGLIAVEGLRRGRSSARETEPIHPVPQRLIDAVLPLVSEQVAAMIQLQLLTGARAGEFCRMRPDEIDKAGKVWIYRPTTHKTAHHGHEREIWLGPKARAVLEPFLKTNPTAYLFSPAEAEADRRARMRQERRTPIQPSQVIRAAQAARKRRQRPLGSHYDVSAHRRAIQRACDQAFPAPEPLARRKGESPIQWRARLSKQQTEELKTWWQQHRWHPHQLRHNAGTYLRKEYGIEVARLILGHRSAAITEIYAEADRSKAVKIMAEVGGENAKRRTRPTLEPTDTKTC
jgi:integrase